ncbi:MAG: AI-2E family transporter [Finegoldia sp.]|nr:AI-2E family transporter [Finegoldia sp.]
MKRLDDKSKNILKVAGLILIMFFALVYINSILKVFGATYQVIRPLIIGLCMAFIVNIPMNFFQTRVFSKILKKDEDDNLVIVLSMLLSWIIFLVSIVLILTVFIPEIINAISTMGTFGPAFVNNILETMSKSDTETIRKVRIGISNALSQINWNDFANGLINFLTGKEATILSTTRSILTSVGTSIIIFLMAFLFSIYVSANKKDLRYKATKMIYAHLDEDRADKLNYVAKLTYNSFSNFIVTRAISCVVLGLLTFVGMKILKMPYAGMIAVLVGAFDAIPYFGPWISTFVGAMLIFIISPIKALIFVVYVLVIQQVQENIIYPLFIGKSVGLPAIWIFASVFVGGGLFGIVGMIASMPVATVIYTLIKDTTNKKASEKNISEEEIFAKMESTYAQERLNQYSENMNQEDIDLMKASIKEEKKK